MHFSHAFVALLSVVGTQVAALPVSNAAAGSSALNAAARSTGIQQPMERAALDILAARGLSSDAAAASRAVFARYANVADEHQRTMFIARDLSKRGILDMLVQAISDLLTELLGTNGSSRKRDASSALSEKQLSKTLTQLTGMDFSTKAAARESWAQMLDSIGKAFEEQATALNATTSANVTGSASASSSKNSTTSALLPSVTSKISANASDEITAAKENIRQGNKATKRAERLNTIDLQARQEGVQGLLEVLRQLVDAILNTLLPMNSRSASNNESAETSSVDCPAPGTPNDGMYRPGCPGYGRRAVTDTLLKVRDAAASADNISQLMPLLQQLMQQIQSSSGSVSTSTQAQAGGSTGGVAAQSAAQESLNVRSLLQADGFELAKRQDSSLASAIIQFIEQILNALGNTSSSGNATSTDDGTTSAKKASKSTSSSSSSDLLSALFSKRDGVNLSILNNLLGNLLSGDNATQSTDADSDKRDGGVNLSILNNLLGNLLSGANASQSSDGANAKRDGINLSILNNLLGNLLSGDNSAQSSDGANAKRDGINLSILNNLLGNLLSGDNSAQSSDASTGANKRDGINLGLLNNLLGNLLSGANASQSSDASNNKRDGINLSVLNNLLGNLLSGDKSSESANTATRRAVEELLSARADFQPVWDEVKKLGNSHFSVNAKSQRRAEQAGLANVWTTFRDMVDSGYKNGLDRRAPAPKVDTSAFTHAAASYMKQALFHQHDRRSIEQFKPLINVAGSFAKQQMQEWTDALNEHSAKHGKTAKSS